jgi:hypothetical protein
MAPVVLSRVTMGCAKVTVGVPTRVMVYELIAPGHVVDATPE